MLNNHYNNVLRLIIQVLEKYTGGSDRDAHASFASLGITSLRSVRLVSDINNNLNTKLKTHDLFLYPTPHALTNYLIAKPTDSNGFTQLTALNRKKHISHEPIAVIAMDCKYPGAEDCEAFWENCVSNKECISFFKKSGCIPSDQQRGSYEVYARGILNNIEYFDAEFFNYSPREAHLSDPQHRLFIEAAWNALEKAGYASDDVACGRVGVYASMNDSTYMLDQCALERSKANLTDRFALQRMMSSQFLATKVAYLLNCTGPSITLQTACSSSLAAVVLACHQLASFECDMAIAGGVSIVTPQDRPYVYQNSNVYSPDGRCRPFDAKARGTVFSNGLGVVVLKRLSEAIHDRDFIVSVIKGYSLNNDGNQKMSYAAPSMQGQMDCILSAQAMAEIEASSIQYVEAHGTGTLIGDPIEIEALTKAFRQSTEKEQFCAIGSVKANIGHTHVAAGIAGLIKASLALKHQKIPPSLHFKVPNPDIDFMHSPFYVNTRLLHWRKHSFPRRAAVSAFGVGGTNAHLILEEAPTIDSCPIKRKTYLLLLSAKSEKALQDYHTKLIHFMETQNPDLNASVKLADLAYTLQVGRNHYPYRSGIVCENFSEALSQLKAQRDGLQERTVSRVSQKKKVVFLFPGQGMQYVNMSYGLYESEPVFQQWLDQCLTLASQYRAFELRRILFPEKENITTAKTKLFQTQYAHPILFSVEYALAKLLQSWGITPDAMLGYSLGEYVAACLAGVFSLEDAMHLVCARGDAISLCDQERVLPAFFSQDEIQSFCADEVGASAEIALNSCVLSGSVSAMQTVQGKIKKVYPEQPFSLKQLENTHPPRHATLSEEASQLFLKALKPIRRNPPRVCYLSNLTGGWVTEAEVLNDQYWVDHTLKAVQLSKCIRKLLDESEEAIFIEVGPGSTLQASVQRNTKESLKTISTLSKPASGNRCDERAMVTMLKELWCHGCTVDWRQFYEYESRSRMPLPTYPFQKERFWVDQIYPHQQQVLQEIASQPDLAFYTPSWIFDPKNRSGLKPLLNTRTTHRWIVFANQSELCRKTCQMLLSNDQEVVKIFQEKDRNSCELADYIINLREKSHYDHVFEKIISHEITHYGIVHFFGTEDSLEFDENNLLDAEALYQGFYSGIFIAQALNRFVLDRAISWVVVTTGVHSVLGDEYIDSLKSGVLSLCRVLPLENPNFKFHMTHLDVDLITNSDVLVYYSTEIINRTVNPFFNCETNNDSKTIALRRGKTWIPSYSQIHVPETQPSQEFSFNHPATYLITGGLGGMGLTVAQWLCNQNNHSTILLLSRSEFPKQDAWENWLITHPTENEVSKKIRTLQQVIKKGCCIKILKADVADFNYMETLITLIEKQFGAIRGIFHLAGISGKGLATLKKMSEIQSVLRPKVQGLQVLIKLFREKELDFFVASSSLTAIAGGVGQIDYCAANIYLDYCLKQKPFKHCKRILTINWNAWRSIGMAANVGQAMHCQLYAGNSVTPDQGNSILDVLMKMPYDQVIVSRYSPEGERQRIKNTFWTSQTQIQCPMDIDKAKQLDIHDIVKCGWEQILGVTNINTKSSFYDHGGDSLTLIQLIAVLEEKIGIKIVLQDLIQYPVFHAMVDFVKKLTIEKRV